MDFVKVLTEWAKNPANEENPFKPFIEWLAEIITFIASL